MSTPPSAKRRRIEGDIITIKVGTGKVESLTVHESLLRARGGFFEAALKQQWREGQTREIELPEDEPDIVAAYIEWLYSGKIEPLSCKPPTPVSHGAMRGTHVTLAKIYVLAEKLGDDDACNVTIDSWVSLLCNRRGENGGLVPVPDWDAIKTIYEGTPVGSPARRFLIFLYSKGPKKRVTNLDGSAHEGYLIVPEFLLDLTCELLPDIGVKRKRLELGSIAETWYKEPRK
ncbi:Putative BTB/POZ domain-containing protein [Septoria linicola]|uniref:BTB/POZ domain-containing protein n=1 Tax=Septoria linicola TaxID=215465 RepID=A0A9Q9AUY4_9PEZI|nr:Putative BTB/POZ domain-containing protein [Septoria linicola]